MCSFMEFATLHKTPRISNSKILSMRYIKLVQKTGAKTQISSFKGKAVGVVQSLRTATARERDRRKILG
jgi:hypothetical protein